MTSPDPIVLLALRGARSFGLSTDTRSAHLAAISVAVSQEPTAVSFVSGWLRSKVVALSAAFTLLVPSAAVATQRAIPGDATYPIKRVIEPFWRVMDRDVVAAHRVEELEALIANDRLSDEHVTEARAAVTGFSDWEGRLSSLLAKRDAALLVADGDRDTLDNGGVVPPADADGSGDDMDENSNDEHDPGAGSDDAGEFDDDDDGAGDEAEGDDELDDESDDDDVDEEVEEDDESDDESDDDDSEEEQDDVDEEDESDDDEEDE